MTAEKKRAGLLLIWLIQAFAAVSQGTTDVRARAEQLFREKRTAEAGKLVQAQLARFEAEKRPDSMTVFLPLMAKIGLEWQGAENTTRFLHQLLAKIKALSPAPPVMQRAYTDASEYWGNAGENREAYNIMQEAYAYAKQLPGHTPEMLGHVEMKLGEYARRLAWVDISGGHYRNAAAHLLRGTPDPEQLYFCYNALGGIMWYASRNDSAVYYFEAALRMIDSMPPAPLNWYYRRALVRNNVAGLYSLMGNSSAAIAAMEDAIRSVTAFLAVKEDLPQKESARALQLEAADNLAGIYKELGNYARAGELLHHSYEQKKKVLPPGDPGIFISQVLLGQLYYARREYAEAIRFLEPARTAISSQGGDYLFWHGDASYGLALVYDKTGRKDKAAALYREADSLYAASFGDAYDNIYLEFLRNMALFYAENGMPQQAVAKAQQNLRYLERVGDRNTLLRFLQLLNMAEIYTVSGKPADALKYSKQALAELDGHLKTSTNALDSITMEVKKPKAVLQKVKAEYELNTAGTDGLIALKDELKAALLLLEKRKALLSDEKDLGLLMADHNELVVFIIRLDMELYRRTKDPAWLKEAVGLHESGIYTRIRTRIDKRTAHTFSFVPPAVTAREEELKKAVTDALQQESGRMPAYLDASRRLQEFREGLKSRYPAYYRMRYGHVTTSVKEMQSRIPANTSVVRYILSGKQMIVWVADRQREQALLLDASGIDSSIRRLRDHPMDAPIVAAELHRLYLRLWKPVEPLVRYRKVMIVPDGPLFQLGFETLVKAPSSGFRKIADNALLHHYGFSYNYSLLMMEGPATPSGDFGNYVAFAPEFSEAGKNRYRAGIKDPLLVDRSYLTLLPLPFSADLTKRMASALGGTVYLEPSSTARNFRLKAGGHKIIHIGTHAEANNGNPEYSRLLFANDSTGGPNSLYLSDLYQCDLRSELAVLTACESGSPGYQDGEGMISLSHAFQYAGSESILMALWEIDEKSSVRITEYFYENLVDGMDKEEALRLAKIKYLRSAEGRTLAPAYWGGLVLLGNTEPVSFRNNRTWPWWVGGAGLAAILLLVFIRKRGK